MFYDTHTTPNGADNTVPEEKVAKLNALDKAFRDRGVVDIKLHMDPSAPLEKLVDDATEIMQAIMDGRTYPMPPLGDSVRGLKND